MILAICQRLTMLGSIVQAVVDLMYTLVTVSSNGCKGNTMRCQMLRKKIAAMRGCCMTCWHV